MTLGRHILLSSMVTMCLAAPALAATTKQSAVSWSAPAPGVDYRLRIDIGCLLPETSWTDMVTMRRIPRGSLYIDYKGPTRFALKLARNQVRRFARRYYEHSENPHKLRLNINGGPVHQWWTREWYDSLPSDKGGAPDVPFVHVYGKEISWKLGPLTISNTLRLKIDYVAAFKLNADPQELSTKVDPIKPPKASSIAIDVHPSGSPINTTTVKFKVRPNIRVGTPHLDDGWWSFIRKLAIRADLMIFIRGRVIVQANAEISYTPGKGVSLKFSIALGIW